MKVNITYRKKKYGISMRVSQTGDINVSASIGMPMSEITRFVESNRQWIDEAVSRKKSSLERKEAFFDQLLLGTPSECAAATRRLNAIIPPLVEKYEKLMGVAVSGLSYRRSKTRWGSCNTRTRHINFSAYLLLLPDWCIEHVVVHELTHLLVPNHSAAFYAVMDKFYPRWREAREETRRISRLEG